AVEMGVDGAIHILCPDDAPLGPTFVARALSSWTKRHGYDLVLAGVMSEDAMAGVTGNLVAAFLSCPCATSVVEVEPVVACDRVQAVSEVEGGVRHVYAIELPAVLAIQTGINVPRYPTLTNVLKARTMKPVTVPIESLGPGDSPEPIRSYRRPEERRKGAFLEGSPRDKAHALADFLRDQGLLP
ncbi:MAG TPA: hypothetical protein PLW83_05615, partial [Deltaproteobacteria bacterium]|nr:hypothetical protein [Deltaproteobacteria bacterium]